MSDIDKDIERVKELQSMIYEGGEYIYLNKNDKQALGNVLKELETRTVQVSGQVQELETWKKVADEIENMFSEECIKLGGYEKDNATPEKERIAGGINILNKLRKKLDWARKEVENGNK